jgi:predicted DCC family thiol-disulfide oxidoreductase YuxK
MGERYAQKRTAAIIYDGRCPLCSAAMSWVKEHELAGSFEMLMCQSEQRRARFPAVIRAECMTAVHVVLPDGAVLVGERALPAIVARLRVFRYAAPLFRLPGAAFLSRAVYRWFAVRRYAVGAVLSHLAGGGPGARGRSGRDKGKGR